MPPVYPCDPGIPESLIYPEFPMNSTDLNWIANYIWGIADDVLQRPGELRQAERPESSMMKS